MSYLAIGPATEFALASFTERAFFAASPLRRSYIDLYRKTVAVGREHTAVGV